MRPISELLMNQEFNDCKTWINKARDNKKTWESINFACKEDEEGLVSFLSSQKEESFWTINAEEWHVLVAEMKEIEDQGSFGFIGEPERKIIETPSQQGCCWVKYRKKLEKPESNFTNISIHNIERNSIKIVSYLSDKTEQDDPIRGMVVGNVQSGKTANMSGVLSMAADYGYNLFIVLTGTIDNLRKQTRERLISDLDYENCNVDFSYIDNPSPKIQYPQRLQDLQLNKGSNKRYLIACLKNPIRLREMINWLNMDFDSKQKLKILLIDDEADQAGINTKDISTEEQTTISSLIKDIVFGNNSKHEKAGPYMSMNYIGYTATPYANFLNETGNKSLYPKNFISLLNTPAEYIGPQQVFGVEGINDGLNIVNKIEDFEIDYINNNVELLSGKLPPALEESLLWFVATVAVFRYRNLKKPVSMLIHTSQKVDRHAYMSQAIDKFFKHLEINDAIDRIKSIYSRQTSLLSIDAFKENIPAYKDIDNIKNYPNFDELAENIKDIIEIGITHINMGENDKLTYNKGLHLCVDNCTKNDLNEYQMRIVYPDKKDEIREISPAFIVIGGSTLSRGLTLEGLTTSYFLRTTSQADTLMQMGRWFGYRNDYELLPRIWLSKKTNSRFNRLTKLDFDLRNELSTMELKGLSPKEYAPRMDSFPDYKLLVLTSKNKMQSKIDFECTFYNKTAQTTWFYRDNNIISNNYIKTTDFLNSLGNVDENRIASLKNPFASKNTIMWFDIGYKEVLNYISSLEIPPQSATFANVDDLIEWFDRSYKNKDIDNFTVMAGGLNERANSDFCLNCGKIIHLQNRMRREYSGARSKDYSKYIDLATVTQSNDRYMDIDCSKLNDFEIEELKGNRLTYTEKRIKYASQTKPLLIVYLIDKDSGNGKEIKITDKYSRLPLSSLILSNHMVGYYIYIPYGKYDTDINKVTVKLNYEEEELNETED